MIPVSPRPHPVRVLGVLGSFAVLSCHNLDSFDTKPGDEYCGTIINTPFQAGFIPEGQPPSLELGLTLDTSKLTSEPGILRSNDATNGLCSANSQPLFQNAPLRAIPALDHDALSTLTFGEGHEHDFFAYVDSTCQGTMLAVVSLLKNNLVEVRLFKPERLPPSTPPPTPAETPGFAVFDMSVENGGCAF
jgi:hypothetical protein